MKLRTAVLLTVMLLAGCRHRGDITEDAGVYAVRSACPIPGVPAGTGDVTLFNPVSSTDSRAIDVTAAISDLRASCQQTATEVISSATFTVTALRRDPGPARQVILPYFDVALQGGGKIAAKRVGQAALVFPAGGLHAWTRIEATIRVNRAATALPESARIALTARRTPGQLEANIDPMTDPAVRNAVANATFEHLVGFQLTQDQLKYNATR